MNNDSKFSLANRKELADMLDSKSDMRSKVKRRFSEKRDALRNSLIQKHADSTGASKLVGQISSAEDNINLWKSELSALGFHLAYDGSLELRDSESKLERSFDKQVEKEIGRVEDIDARFDSIQIAILTVATPEEAKKLVESVSEIQ